MLKEVWILKHIFIINPAAGSHDATDEVRNNLENSNLDIDYEIYRTTAPGDATNYIKTVCKDTSNTYRFYACGGDGTLNEVVSALVNVENASATVYPHGSGNDFIKYYGPIKEFCDLESLVNGVNQKIDIMKVQDKYSINVVHFGFDTAVLRTMMKVRRHKIFGGKNAYTTGVVTAFINGMKTKCKVLVDGKQVGNNNMLLCTVANGKYVGGKYQCAPKSDNSDGLMEICHVSTLSRIKFLQLINCYTKGQHLDDPKLKKYITYCKGKQVEIIGETDDFNVSLDGELNIGKSFKVEIIKQAVNFSVPKKLAEKLKLERNSDTVVC